MRSLTCEVCGAEFLFRTNGRPARFCSSECRRDENARRSREARKTGRWVDRRPKKGPWQGSRVCRYCDQEFEAQSPKATVCYADDCQKRKHADRCRPYTAERRAKKRQVETERFDDVEIFERDAWICQICFEPVDPSLRWPHPLSRSLDHVVPIRDEGPHTRENTQLAHLRCNTSRQARPLEAVRRHP